jgi:hypothetical protein
VHFLAASASTPFQLQPLIRSPGLLKVSNKKDLKSVSGAKWLAGATNVFIWQYGDEHVQLQRQVLP